MSPITQSLYLLHINKISPERQRYYLMIPFPIHCCYNLFVRLHFDSLVFFFLFYFTQSLKLVRFAQLLYRLVIIFKCFSDMSTPPVCATDKSFLVSRLLLYTRPKTPNEHKTENFNLASVQLSTRYGNFGNFLQYSLWMRLYMVWYSFCLSLGVGVCVCAFLNVSVRSMLFITTVLRCSCYLSHSIGFCAHQRAMRLMNAYIIPFSQYFPSPFFSRIIFALLFLVKTQSLSLSFAHPSTSVYFATLLLYFLLKLKIIFLTFTNGIILSRTEQEKKIV